jgi:IS5 family transposase
MFLKYRYGLGFESLCREVTDSIGWQRFCRIPLGGRVPHPTTVMKITTRCGQVAVDGLNEALLARAVEAKGSRRTGSVPTRRWSTPTWLKPQASRPSSSRRSSYRRSTPSARTGTDLNRPMVAAHDASRRALVTGRHARLYRRITEAQEHGRRGADRPTRDSRRHPYAASERATSTGRGRLTRRRRLSRTAMERTIRTTMSGTPGDTRRSAGPVR